MFYQKIPPNVGISESEAKDFEELPLSLNLYKEISEVLGLSNTKLPGLTSNMKEWKIGSLRRFAGPTSNSS